MLSIDRFQSEVVAPIIEDARQQPDMIHRAFSAVWAVDAFASHVAWAIADATGVVGTKQNDTETTFKNELEESGHYGAWRFKVIRALSNSTKHGRPNSKKDVAKRVVKHSAQIGIIDQRGLGGWFQRSEHWGDMVVVELDVAMSGSTRKWLDSDGLEYQGLVFKTVPILNLIDPSIELIRSKLLFG